MKHRNIGLATIAFATLGPACAGDGLQAPSAAALWPQWQVRMSLQSGNVSTLAVTQFYKSRLPSQTAKHGAVLGDYYFASRSFGKFRASGGMLLGSLAGASLKSTNAITTACPLLDWEANKNQSAVAAITGNDISQVVPYFGVGLTGLRWGGLSVSADVGLTAEHLGAANALGRAMFGNQGAKNTLRDMHLSPMLQLGLRYTF